MKHLRLKYHEYGPTFPLKPKMKIRYKITLTSGKSGVVSPRFSHDDYSETEKEAIHAAKHFKKAGFKVSRIKKVFRSHKGN